MMTQENGSLDQHTDDDAVDMFAKAMKDKLAKARAKGRSGWQTCTPDLLSQMLREHVDKGDPRDVANFCMFLWMLCEPISAATEDDSIEWQIEVSGPAGYVRFETFHGETLEDAMRSVRKQGFCPAPDEDGFVTMKVKA